MRKVAKRNYPRYWKPLQKANYYDAEPIAVVRAAMEQYNLSEEEARKLLDEEFAKCEYWVNDLYQVEVRVVGSVPMEDRPDADLVQLNIRRRDGLTDARDWRHFQAIKNQLIGEECEAIELYPAESRKVDTSNKFHLWAVKDPTYRFPIGWKNRDVRYGDEKQPGLRQRPF